MFPIGKLPMFLDYYANGELTSIPQVYSKRTTDIGFQYDVGFIYSFLLYLYLFVSLSRGEKWTFSSRTVVMFVAATNFSEHNATHA